MQNNNETSTILLKSFSERCANNRHYSLRAFSRSLGVSHSLLSLIMSGKRRPSPELSKRIIEHFGTDQRDGFHAGTIPYVDIGLESFDQISSWIHYAILGLVHIPSFKADPKWIATKLEISPTKAAITWQQLVTYKYVTFVDGVWKQAPLPITVSNKKSTASTRKFTKDLLAIAITTLENEPFETRQFGSTTFAIREEDVPYAREQMKLFRRALCQELEERGTPNRVYALTTELFPLSKKIISEDSLI